MNDVYGMHRRARDRTRIRAGDPLEVRYWSTSLCCTEAELCAAMNEVGTNTESVRQYLSEARA